MTSNLDLSKINTPFDIIKLKNDFLGETNKVYLKSVFETNCFKIKELYRLYVAYDKELNKELNYKIDQKILDKTLYVKNVYDLTSIILEDYSLNTHEWNFLFEELNTNLNLNKIKESKDKILNKINKENFKEHNDEIYLEIINKYCVALLNFCKNEMHVNTFMTKRIKTKFLDLNMLSTSTIEVLEEVVNRETLKQMDDMDNLMGFQKNYAPQVNYTDDLYIEPFDDSFLDEEEEFRSVYLDFSETKSLDDLLKEIS